MLFKSIWICFNLHPYASGPQELFSKLQVQRQKGWKSELVAISRAERIQLVFTSWFFWVNILTQPIPALKRDLIVNWEVWCWVEALAMLTEKWSIFTEELVSYVFKCVPLLQSVKAEQTSVGSRTRPSAWHEWVEVTTVQNLGGETQRNLSWCVQ